MKLFIVVSVVFAVFWLDSVSSIPNPQPLPAAPNHAEITRRYAAIASKPPPDVDIDALIAKLRDGPALSIDSTDVTYRKDENPRFWANISRHDVDPHWANISRHDVDPNPHGWANISEHHNRKRRSNNFLPDYWANATRAPHDGKLTPAILEDDMTGLSAE